MYNYYCSAEDRSNCSIGCGRAGRCQSQNEAEICPKTKQPLKLLGETIIGLMGAKMSKAAIKKDRKARSRKHFKKVIYPSLAKNDQKSYDMNQRRKKLLGEKPL